MRWSGCSWTELISEMVQCVLLQESHIVFFFTCKNCFYLNLWLFCLKIMPLFLMYCWNLSGCKCLKNAILSILECFGLGTIHVPCVSLHLLCFSFSFYVLVVFPSVSLLKLLNKNDRLVNFAEVSFYVALQIPILV